MADKANFEQLLARHADGAELARLVRYAELLERWSRAHNLVSWRSREELVERHVVAALAARTLLGDSGRMLDVGSGAGLPAVPLLAVRPRWRGVLLEPRQKRWAFLRTVVRALDLEAEVTRTRYQDYDGDAGGYDVVTARALGGYETLARWARRRLAEGGRVLLWVTVDIESTLRDLPDWRVLSSSLPGMERGRLVQMIPCFT